MSETENSKSEGIELIYEALDGMAQGIIVHTGEEILYSNSKTIELLEIPAELVVKGASFQKFIEFSVSRGDEKDAPEEKIMDIATAENIPDTGQLVERSTPSGKIIQVAIKPGKNGKRITTYTDVTEDRSRERDLAKATKSAESAERAKAEFLANMSHEIRTPMNGVMGMSELLAATDLDPKQKMFTDIILKSGASLLTIINDILDFSKIDAGQMELDPAPFNLSEAIEDVAALVSAKTAEKDLRLLIRIAPNLPEILIGDVGRIRQVMMNLLGNAVKFTDRGHVYVNVEGAIGHDANIDIAKLKFSVTDTGIGIPKEKYDQVFQKFNQADTSATRKHEGTGLGLSISSSLVKLMGGDIHVESDSGSGSTFWFTLELPLHTTLQQNQKPMHDGLGARVLVIADNEIGRSILSEQLTAWNLDSAAASSGSEGHAVMRAVIKNGLQLDLVIIDQHMPIINSAKLIKIMRTDDTLKHIPIIQLASVDHSQNNRNHAAFQADASLIKPTRSSMLHDTIFQIIGKNKDSVKAHTRAVSHQDHANATTIKDAASADKNQQLDILVAEDNEINQIVMRQVLEDTDLTFEIVANGRLAVESYKRHQPRIILMDVSMPEMNGNDATRQIRNFEIENNLDHTPIIAVTAHALKGDLDACLDVGMDDYLSKPVSPNRMMDKIEHWIEQKSVKTSDPQLS